MGIFFEKPTKGPDVVGGVWPIRDRGRCWNRSGATVVKGEVVQLAWTAGVATEIATNDDNSYIPGASNDTVWNTVIAPRSNGTTLVAGAHGSSINTGGIFGVCLDTSVADNASGLFQFFGLVEEAYVRRSNMTATIPGSPLTVKASLTGAPCFDPVILSNEVVVATLLDFSNAGALTTRRLRRVMLHNGIFFQRFGGTAFTAT
jgi:hypothetical protein